jgi:peptidoglycan hydrolase CwlO-like protein
MFKRKVKSLKGMMEKHIRVFLTTALIIVLGAQTVNAGSYDDQKEAAQNEIYQAQQAIEELKDLKSDVEAYVKEIDSSISQMNANINSINAQCNAKQQEIDTSVALIAQTEAEIEKQYEDMKKRIKFMYENADTQYVEMILGSENFSDFLNKADFFRN